MGGWEKSISCYHVKPHRPVSLSIFSRWLKQLLAMSDTEVFKVHSNQSAAVSTKAEVIVVSLTNIIKLGHGSQTSTFQKFYRKVSRNTIPILFSIRKPQQAVLKREV